MTSQHITVPARGLRRFWPLAVLGTAIAAFFVTGLNRYVSFDALLERRAQLHVLVSSHEMLMAFAFACLYALFVMLSLPGASLLTVTGGLLFGGFAGGALAVVAASFGGTLLFLIARSSLGGVLRNRAAPALTKLRDGLERDSTWWLLFLRLAPVFPFWLVNLGLAALNVPLRRFIWTTMLGIIPATFVFAFAGDSLDAIVAQRQHAYAACVAQATASCHLDLTLGMLVNGHILALLAALAGLSLLPVALRRWRTHS